MRAWSLLSLLLVTASAWCGSPAEAAQAAAADIIKVPLEARKYTRYLTDYAIPEKSAERLTRADWKIITEFQVNSLSTERDFDRPRQVGPTVYAIDIRNYGWKPEVWERLAKAEPFFHDQPLTPLPQVKVEAVVAVPQEEEVEVTEEKEVKVKKPWPGGVWPGDGPDKGKHFPQGAFEILAVEKQQVKVRKKVPSLPTKAQDSKPKALDTKEAPLAWWVPAGVNALLVKETQSKVPIVASDWFLFQTSIQQDRVAGYYDFLGVGKKESDFQALGGVDPKLVVVKKQEMAGAFARSKVTKENRVVVRLPAATRAYWFTLDFKKSTGESNVIRQIRKLGDDDKQEPRPPKGDASRQYLFLLNGLFAFGLFDGEGARQDVAPGFIAGDRHGRENDLQVHVGMSCIRCHTPGLMKLDDEYMRGTYDSPLALASPSYEKNKKIRQLYFSNISAELEDDTAYYARKLKELNGTTPARMSKLYEEAWYDVAERPVTADDFARRLGVDTKFMLDSFRKVGVGGLDPVLGGFIARNPRTLRQAHADEIYSEAQKVLRGYRTP